MKQILESIKQFFSGITGKKLLPSTILRSGLPSVYKQTKILEKPKHVFTRFVDTIKGLFSS